MPHINGLSHPQDPNGANFVQSNLILATSSIGSGIMAGTLAGVDASGAASAAISHVALPAAALAGIPLPSFTTLAFLTQGSLDLWIFIFAFVSVGLATTNLYLGFWMKRQEVSDYAKAYNLAEEEYHKNETLSAQLASMEEENRKLRAQMAAAQGGTPTGTNPQTDKPTPGDEHDHDHEPKAGGVFPRSV